MKALTVNKVKYGLVCFAFIFVAIQLAIEHFHGGVERHYLMADPEMPSFSNWWGLVILPVFAWLAAILLKKRVGGQIKSDANETEIPRSFVFGLFGMLIVSALQSVAFEVGFPSVTMYLALAVLLVSLFVPIYRAECFFGHLVGATFTFGPIIPLIGISITAIVSAASHFIAKPILRKIFRR